MKDQFQSPTIHPIVTIPAKILRKELSPYSESDKVRTKDLVKSMLASMHEAEGIGLSANQIGLDKQIAVLEIPERKLVMINPCIVKYSKEIEGMEEGCLSVPGAFHQVERPAKIEVEFEDEEGNRKKMKAEGLLARVIQHEVDHLRGIIILDRANKPWSEKI